ncbi:hypothetical protein CHARACLAT_015899 [Characodon lateralis]|uniref:IQ domain-containing protein C n=1 Tax=Characodon lateralis TaxID=208331 RepID=A0ABU7E153_9TELE|nr:hypothetical protein [Characodon lateralis]
MDSSKWNKIITRFQACARGHLARTEVRRAREDFEEIVREIEGGLTHLRWTDTTPSIPYFTDTVGVCLRPASCLLKSPDPELDVDSPQSSNPSPAVGQDLCVQPERKEAKREDWSSIPVRGEEGVIERGPQQYCLAQEVPRTSEALRLHRNALTMELVWLQQAIGSRKKYLSLKDRLSVS